MANSLREFFCAHSSAKGAHMSVGRQERPYMGQGSTGVEAVGQARAGKVSPKVETTLTPEEQRQVLMAMGMLAESTDPNSGNRPYFVDRS